MNALNIATVWMLCVLLPATAAAVPATGAPFVYPSPNGLGARPTTLPYPISAGNGRQLVLYIDYDNVPDVGPSTSGNTMCVDKNGDETCAFDVALQFTTGTTASVMFSTFAPGASGIVGQIATGGRSLRVNGIKTSGMSIPAKIGTVTVNAAGAQQLQIEVVGVHRVGAGGQLDAIQRRTIVPEPGRVALLGSGIAGLVAIRALRRWRRRTAT